MSYIKIRNLSYSYQDDDGNPVSVLKNLSLDIEKGEYVAILGHNGSGKSTLAKLLNLVIDDYEYFEGTIEIDGVDTPIKNSDGTFNMDAVKALAERDYSFLIDDFRLVMGFVYD